MFPMFRANSMTSNVSGWASDFEVPRLWGNGCQRAEGEDTTLRALHAYQTATPFHFVEVNSGRSPGMKPTSLQPKHLLSGAPKGVFYFDDFAPAHKPR